MHIWFSTFSLHVNFWYLNQYTRLQPKNQCPPLFTTIVPFSDSSGSTKLPDRPWNLAVTVGQRVEMKCKSDNISKITEWSIQRPSSLDKRSIWGKWRSETRIRNAHFHFDVDGNGSVALYSNSTQLDYGGIYTCVLDRTPRQPERYSAQLIVFGKFSCNPVCLNSCNMPL